MPTASLLAGWLAGMRAFAAAAAAAAGRINVLFKNLRKPHEVAVDERKRQLLLTLKFQQNRQILSSFSVQLQ